MSATISRPAPSVLRHAGGRRGGSRRSARASFVSMGDVSMSSSTPRGGGGGGATSPELRVTSSPPTGVDPAGGGHPDLRFDRLQPPEPECNGRHRRVFGRFVAREALLEEEFWTAAWLRAESHWEDQPFLRHAESYKRMFAEKEFTAIKRRSNGQNAEQCTCIVVVKREEKNVKRTVLNSIVGTLDISIRFLLQGEKFPGVWHQLKLPNYTSWHQPQLVSCRRRRRRHHHQSLISINGERRRGSVFSSIYKADKPRYAYVANLCVAKHARRQGIATNMLYLAAEATKSYGVDQMFVHVNSDNVPAKGLYQKLGFQIVEVTTAQEEQKLMLLKC